MSQSKIAVETRTEFGKGAARRTRRAGRIPAVLYGHGTDPQHLSLPSREFAAIIREQGRNAVIELDIPGKSTELALTKTVTVHPLRPYIEHVDLLLIRRGEKVSVEVQIVITGEPRSSTLVTQDLTTIEIEADALHIPETIEVSVEGVDAGTQILAGALTLPEGTTLVTDPEALVVNVVAAPSAEQLEGGEAGEGAAEAPAEEG